MNYVIRLKSGKYYDGSPQSDGCEKSGAWLFDSREAAESQLEEGETVEVFLGEPSGKISSSPLSELKKENFELRAMLAVVYCRSIHNLYHDDGELQDSSSRPFIDWKRDTVDEIQLKLIQRAQNKEKEEQLLVEKTLREAVLDVDRFKKFVETHGV